MTLDSQEATGPYDYIIVGASPAGCVLANRLSVNPSCRVLLVEAGDDATPGREHPDIRDPFPASSSNAKFHWPGLQVAYGLGGKVSHPYVKARVVGGGSNVNGMAADRGQPSDYDSWAMEGAKGWSWKDVAPYFDLVERDLDTGASNAGKIPIRRLRREEWGPFASAVAGSLQRSGYEFIEDYLRCYGEGVASVPTNAFPEGRVSASMAYLTDEVRRRPNLVVRVNTLADRVVFEGRTARGVSLCTEDGGSEFVAARQVVLSCGGIQSPSMLMRSGVGPPALLQSLGIPIVVASPSVGRRLQNHPRIFLGCYLSRAGRQQADNPYFLQNWLRYSSGLPACSPNDMHLIIINRTAWHSLGASVGALAVSVLEAFSQGYIEIVSRDPRAMPKVALNLCADARDFDRLVEGTRFCLQLSQREDLKRHCSDVFLPNADLVRSLRRRSRTNAFRARALIEILAFDRLRRLALGSSKLDVRALLSDTGKLEKFVQANVGPQSHDCGACRMGEGDDAVVDSQARVRGVDGLRIVDASIFPKVTRGYPHLIVMAMAEKLADAMRQQ